MDRFHVSVIIPAYNAEHTIGEALDSVQKQTRAADEIIIIDDGSEDRTAEYATNHPSSPRIIRTKNQGAAAALNRGIEHASGNILAFLDADDIWLPDKLELQCKLIGIEPGIKMVLSYFETFICPSIPEEIIKRLVFPVGPQPGYLLGTLMARSEVFTRYGNFDPELRTGYFIDWFSKIKCKGVNYKLLDDILLKRRIRNGTLGQRTGNNDRLSTDFVEIARRAIARNRNNQTDIS